CSEEIRMLSADFWCETRAAVKKKFGDVYVLPQCAAAGDVAPRILHYKKAQNRRFALKYGEDAPPDAAERADIAERIVAAAEEVYSWAKKDIKTGETIAHASKTLELEGKYKTEIRAVKIGEIAFAANQFELFTDYMHRIQARSPFAQTFVIQLAAGGGTYLATERAHASKGYGANEDNAVSPDGGRELVEETLELLRSIC
ncbi:MAG: hypothetical protein FWF03_07605, partial [Defluviitaleaceae bacterium]|nr:hypothetical protein [Defluviitaleaceae bacterium]